MPTLATFKVRKTLSPGLSPKALNGVEPSNPPAMPTVIGSGVAVDVGVGVMVGFG